LAGKYEDNIGGSASDIFTELGVHFGVDVVKYVDDCHAYQLPVRLPSQGLAFLSIARFILPLQLAQGLAFAVSISATQLFSFRSVWDVIFILNQVL
jgi:hypothetical protein